MAKPDVNQKVAAVFAQLAMANPEVFAAGFTRAAVAVLKKAGHPTTWAELDAIVETRIGGRLTRRPRWRQIQIEHRATAVAAALDVLIHARGLDHYVSGTNVRNAVAQTARLFGAVAQAVAIDDAPYLREGRQRVAGRQQGAAATKAKAAQRREIAARMRDEVSTRNPRLSAAAVAEKVATRMRAEHADLCDSTWSGSSVARSLRREK